MLFEPDFCVFAVIKENRIADSMLETCGLLMLLLLWPNVNLGVYSCPYTDDALLSRKRLATIRLVSTPSYDGANANLIRLL
jgi:hypothetical protein